MDKILQSMGDEHARKAITVTNDGATILGSIWIDNPAAKILIDISKTQDEEVGDGTTTVAVMAGELLKEAEKLVMQKIHPQIIIKGWRQARDVAKKTLDCKDEYGNTSAFYTGLLSVYLQAEYVGEPTYDAWGQLGSLTWATTLTPPCLTSTA